MRVRLRSSHLIGITNGVSETTKIRPSLDSYLALLCSHHVSCRPPLGRPGLSSCPMCVAPALLSMLYLDGAFPHMEAQDALAEFAPIPASEDGNHNQTSHP